jgi:hypothetical protein
MARRGNQLRTFVRLPVRRKLLLLEAAIALAIGRLMLFLLSFRRIAAWMGSTMGESPADMTPPQQDAAAEIGWAVRVMANRLPWQNVCFPQALAALWMLKWRRIPATVYFGVMFGEDRTLAAHAWVRSGRQLLTGANGHEQFTVVAKFAG